jgi:hypothetical protein
MTVRRSWRSGRAALVATALLWTLVGCGTSPQPAPSSPPPTAVAPASATPSVAAAACADIATLRGAVEALRTVNPSKDGSAALTNAIKNVQTSLDAAQASAAASPELQPALASVKTAVAGLQSAAEGLTAGNVAQKAPGILRATQQVATAMSDLSTVVDRVCP